MYPERRGQLVSNPNMCAKLCCCGSQGMNDSKLMVLLNGSEYVPIYEDKDSDRMLIGNILWNRVLHANYPYA